MVQDPLQLAFYVVIGLTGLVVAFALFKIVFRNVPLWLFEFWPYLTGFGIAAFLFLAGFTWMFVAAAAGLGVAMGLSWSALLNHCKNKGYEHSKLEAVHRALVRWAQK